MNKNQYGNGNTPDIKKQYKKGFVYIFLYS
jgi:hypothetical protein